MLNVVFDTNVLISGLLWVGAPNRLFFKDGGKWESKSPFVIDYY